ncbi:tyrosine-type recombinase/integrase [Halorussus sp. MSC15.2]|nr:tyrosine-type recombinase/integrase [Halorussus sp. MSC15.2]
MRFYVQNTVTSPLCIRAIIPSDFCHPRAVPTARTVDNRKDSSSARRTDIEDALADYVRSKAVADPEGNGSGNYVSNAESVVRRWADWLDREEGVESLAAVEPIHLRRYARHLKTKVRQDEYAASTARTYYAYVRAFLTWCSRDHLLESNPAEDEIALEELPDDPGTRETQQFWSPDDRRQLESYVRQRALEAIESGDETQKRKRLRQHALVALLAHTGVRGAEVFSHPKDDRRNGATWADVDWENGSLRVLGKSQEYEYAPLPEVAQKPLRRWKDELEPPTTEFPLFPTEHAPSKYGAVRSQVTDIDLETADIDAVVRENEVVLPAISTEGARSVMKRLCDEADLEVDGEYLKPHGARRGLGDELYRSNPTDAQAALRHSSISVTNESYSHIEAGEIGDVIDNTRERGEDER